MLASGLLRIEQEMEEKEIANDKINKATESLLQKTGF